MPDVVAAATLITMILVTEVAKVRVSRLVVAIAALMLAIGILRSVLGSEGMTKPGWLGVAAISGLMIVQWFQVRPSAPKPWRDQGRFVLWVIGIVCLLGATSFWLSAVTG